ncbi:tetratricopeptide repeat protein [Actinokineospora bangkokensis]|uniref:hypothetical protein n=1 Tax=Actinokineospora bangkokensis TaxID=1193682 RepID=UPI001177F162|nr:hypothetical protein [Actinokineospora bangkokensis]
MGDKSEHAPVLDLLEAVDLDRRGAAAVGAWLAGHRADLVAGVRACDRDGVRRAGLRLAGAAWAAAGLVPEPRWWAELAEAGEALAIAERDPEALVGLLDAAAAVFADHGDRVRAEERWVRALSVARRAGSPGQDRLLVALAGLYRGWGRLGKALDAQWALVELRAAAGDALGSALARAEVGATMHAAGRTASAVEHLERAQEAAALAGAGPVEHARLLVWCGWARWAQGGPGAAKRCWSRALALLVDVDEDAAQRVRDLLAHGPGDGATAPYLSTGASSSDSSSSAGAPTSGRTGSPNTASSPSGGAG